MFLAITSLLTKRLGKIEIIIWEKENKLKVLFKLFPLSLFWFIYGLDTRNNVWLKLNQVIFGKDSCF